MKIRQMKTEQEMRDSLSVQQTGMTPFVEQNDNGTWEAGIRVINLGDENIAQATALKILQCVLKDLYDSGITPKEVVTVG